MSTPVLLELGLLTLAASGTALATGLGALPVGAPRLRALPEGALWGLTAGVMTATAVAGLLRPALVEGSPASVASGALLGLVLVLGVRALARDRGGARARTSEGRASMVVFAVLFAHSLPEGLAIGTAAAAEDAGLGAFVILAIALQNIPEGTATALPMAAAGDPARRRNLAAVASSLPQVPGAVLAFLLVDAAQGVLPLCFAAAGSAMVAVVVAEISPQILRRPGRSASLAAACAGAAGVTGLAIVLGV